MCLFPDPGQVIVTVLGVRMVHNASGEVLPLTELSTSLITLENHQINSTAVLRSKNLFELRQPASFSGSFKWSFDQ